MAWSDPETGDPMHVEAALRTVEHEVLKLALTWRAMLFAGKPPISLPVDAFLGTVVLEEKDHFVGRPRLGYLRIEIS